MRPFFLVVPQCFYGAWNVPLCALSWVRAFGKFGRDAISIEKNWKFAIKFNDFES